MQPSGFLQRSLHCHALFITANSATRQAEQPSIVPLGTYRAFYEPPFVCYWAPPVRDSPYFLASTIWKVEVHPRWTVQAQSTTVTGCVHWQTAFTTSHSHSSHLALRFHTNAHIQPTGLSSMGAPLHSSPILAANILLETTPFDHPAPLFASKGKCTLPIFVFLHRKNVLQTMWTMTAALLSGRDLLVQMICKSSQCCKDKLLPSFQNGNRSNFSNSSVLQKRTTSMTLLVLGNGGFSTRTLQPYSRSGSFTEIHASCATSWASFNNSEHKSLGPLPPAAAAPSQSRQHVFPYRNTEQKLLQKLFPFYLLCQIKQKWTFMAIVTQCKSQWWHKKALRCECY